MMSEQEARRCIAAIAEYLERRDESPRAAADLRMAVAVLQDAAVAQAAKVRNK